VLHLAGIVDDLGLKKFYYRYASQRFLSQAGYFNLAMIALDENKNDVALTYLDQIDEDDDVLNARGVIELRKGNYDQARTLFLRSQTADAKKNLGTLLILSGQYAEAAQQLAGSGSGNEVLAYILDGQIDEAVKNANCDTPRDAYIAAIAYARAGQADKAREALSKASVDPDYAEKSEKDVEFVDIK
jgi:tetratricopeptide (TPR) repeat protein